MQSDLTKQPKRLPRGAVLLWATPSKDVGPAGYSIVQELKTDPKVSAPTPNSRNRAGSPKGSKITSKPKGGMRTDSKQKEKRQ
jgi:hypothetical protein